MKIITNKNKLFVAEIKGHISNLDSEILNFPPIFRNIDIFTSKQNIGETMYNYMKKVGISTDKKERKLTQLIDTNGEYMAFSSYYLWFLMDRCNFVIDDIKSITLFSAHDKFKTFVTEFMDKRIEAILARNGGQDKFRKLCLNGSYGYDIMNEENFGKTKLKNKSQTFHEVMKDTYKTARKLNDDLYQVMVSANTFGCKTCIQEGFFTLDNAKFWYLNFIYNFMYKCLDMSKIQFVEGDTDSAYFAIAGNPNEPNTQGFKHVILDHEFYNKHIYEWAPSDFYSSDSSNPVFTSKLEQLQFDKKLLGLAIEKQSDSMVALAPKVYTCFNSEKTISTRSKGVNPKQNPTSADDYIKVLEEESVKTGANTNLQLHNALMTKIKMVKNALTCAHTKMFVLDDFSTCIPLQVCIN
jgi:hypothetical protein